MMKNSSYPPINASFLDILKPLQDENHPFEYKNHCKSVECFVDQFCRLENTYADIYQQLLTLEKKVISSKNMRNPVQRPILELN